MEAVYGLLHVDRGVPEVWGSVYDIRELLGSSVKLMDGKSPLEIELPAIVESAEKTDFARSERNGSGKSIARL